MYLGHCTPNKQVPQETISDRAKMQSYLLASNADVREGCAKVVETAPMFLSPFTLLQEILILPYAQYLL